MSAFADVYGLRIAHRVAVKNLNISESEGTGRAVEI